MPVSLETIDPAVAILTVNRPQVRNALDWAAIAAFGECIEETHTQKGLRALIVTGAGGGFIAGGDLKALYNSPTEADGEHLSRTMSHILNRLEALPCPTIAAINGPARGGGAEIALACDLRVMSEDADLGLVQINLGLIPGWGAGQRLLRLVGYSLALELLVTGRVLSADDANSYGLANQVAPVGAALPAALELASLIAAKPDMAVKSIKRALRGGIFLTPQSAEAGERDDFPALWAGETHLQAVQSFVERKAKPPEERP